MALHRNTGRKQETFQTQRLGDEGLADAGGPAEEHRGALRDEAARGQVPETGPGDIGVEGEIEVAQITDVLEAGAIDTAGDRLGFTARQLVVQQQE
jgi:hypothetical protein